MLGHTQLETGNAQTYFGRLDISIIGIYMAACMVVGLLYARRGTKNMESFFIGGRNMPWLMLSISLTATCFAADTPLWLGDMIFRRGLEGAWLYWVGGIGAAFFVFVLAPLWRRTRVVTDLEFLELRYSGKAAPAMRLIISLYYSIFFNIMMMAVSTLSITTIMAASTGWSKGICVIITMGGAMVYCVVSGLWGVAATDFLQFFVATIGSIILAVLSVRAAGGTGQLVGQLHSLTDWPGHELNMIPRPGLPAALPILSIVYIFTFRWVENASMGTWVSQRLFACKSAKDATFCAMLFAGIYYSLVPISWIVTIVAAKIVMPAMTLGQEAYPRMAMEILPQGLRGVLIASMLAAFMSTYSSLLSWGSSYVVNDFWRRFLVKNASQRHYVVVGQASMVPMALGSALIAYKADSILNLVFYIYMATTGYFAVTLLRWLWWRINAWSEISALLSSIGITLLIMLLKPEWVQKELLENYYGHRMLMVSCGSLVVFLVVTLLTRPTEPRVLDDFYRRCTPPGFWGPVRRRLGVKPSKTWGDICYGWFVMLLTIYGPLVGIPKMIFGEPALGVVLTTAGIIGALLAVRKARAARFPEEEPGRIAS